MELFSKRYILLVAVFPANVHMALNPEQVRGLDLDKVPRWALWAGCRCSLFACLGLARNPRLSPGWAVNSRFPIAVFCL